jgi:hypothetical protein
MDVNQDGVMIQRLLDFKEKLDTITQDALTGASDVKEAVKKSFQVFINKRSNKPAELVAKFIDSYLKKKNASAGFEGVLDQLLVLFRFIQGKDVFEAFYQKDLARRLLNGKLALIDTEQYLVKLLKVECGIELRNNLKQAECLLKNSRLCLRILKSPRIFPLRTKILVVCLTSRRILKSSLRIGPRRMSTMDTMIVSYRKR